MTGFPELDLNISHLNDGIFLLRGNTKQGQSCFSLTKNVDKIWKKGNRHYVKKLLILMKRLHAI